MAWNSRRAKLKKLEGQTHDKGTDPAVLIARRVHDRQEIRAQHGGPEPTPLAEIVERVRQRMNERKGQ